MCSSALVPRLHHLQAKIAIATQQKEHIDFPSGTEYFQWKFISPQRFLRSCVGVSNLSSFWSVKFNIFCMEFLSFSFFSTSYGDRLEDHVLQCCIRSMYSTIFPFTPVTHGTEFVAVDIKAKNN